MLKNEANTKMTSTLIFDDQRIEDFRKRAKRNSQNGCDFLLTHMVDDLSERLAAVERKFDLAIDLHGHTGLAVDALLASHKVKKVIRVETDDIYKNHDEEFLTRSREFLNLTPKHYDLIVSLLSLHLTNDTPGVLTQIKNSLKPDGLFLGVMAGAGTLGELRESLIQAETEIYGGVSPRIYPFADVRDAGALLQRAGFSMPVTDIENLTVRYDNIFDLMRDLRAMGMQNALINRSKKPVSQRFFIRAAEIYAERFSDPDGRIRASFCFIWFSGWAPDESQQKPMRPGTAKMSLADAITNPPTKKPKTTL